jgi:hypothetical protein
MAEIEKEASCTNCGSVYRLMYDTDSVSYEADNCPFCGDLINGYDNDFDFKSEEEDMNMDDWNYEDSDDDFRRN